MAPRSQCSLDSRLQIVEAVSPVRDNLDAILVFPSMPACMRLNKLGSFSMSQLGQGKSVISDFMKKQVGLHPPILLALVRLSQVCWLWESRHVQQLQCYDVTVSCGSNGSCKGFIYC